MTQFRQNGAIALQNGASVEAMVMTGQHAASTKQSANIQTTGIRSALSVQINGPSVEAQIGPGCHAVKMAPVAS